MKPLLLTIALLFSSPAWAYEPGCKTSISLESLSEDLRYLDDILSGGRECSGFGCADMVYPVCNVIVVQVDKNLDEMHTIAQYCRFDREIVFIENPDVKDDKFVGFTCVPKKINPSSRN